MKATPASNRKHIALFGAPNAGKSSLFNALLGQERAITSDIPGTTTDPVSKAMELLPFGPVVLVDTAGLGDDTPLGAARRKKTERWLALADLALYVIDAGRYDAERLCEMKKAFDKHRLPYLIVFMKSDLYQNVPDAEPSDVAPDSFRVSIYDPASVENLRSAIASALRERTDREGSLIGGLVKEGGVVVMVVPIDSEAPAGRLILPQVQLIRDCLDYSLRCHVTTERQLSGALTELPRIDLVVTDSQLFGFVDGLLPKEMPLTSFSILTARQKGNIQGLYDACETFKALKPGDKILIAEACTHTTAHEDIGRVKIPRALEKLAGGKLLFEFAAGPEFPQDLSGYKLIAHCGGCMLTRRAFLARQDEAARQGVPFTNYGLTLAYCGGVLERAIRMILPKAFFRNFPHPSP